ncbi:MAG: hypothetical protein WB643_12415 [Candidatus Bathyarchaeia archaeon]
MPTVKNVAAEKATGRAQFTVLNFTQTDITWTLGVVVYGDVSNRSLWLQLEGNILRSDFTEFDPSTNTTSMSFTFTTPFSQVYGSFPNQTWSLSFYFAVDADLKNQCVGDFSVQLPTSNYGGTMYVCDVKQISASSAWSAAGALPGMTNYGVVYHFTLDITLNSGVRQQLDIGMVQFPKILYALLLLLSFAFLLDVTSLIRGLLARSQRVRKLIESFPFRLPAVLSYRIDGAFLTVVVGVLFFLPIYMLSLRTFENPIPITDGDLAMIRLTLYYSGLLFLSVFVYILRGRNSSDTS